MMHKIEYDPEVKILKIRLRRGKSVDSEVEGNIVLDYNSKGELVKLENMDINLEDFVHSSSGKAGKFCTMD